jgi:hypothetical protein
MNRGFSDGEEVIYLAWWVRSSYAWVRKTRIEAVGSDRGWRRRSSPEKDDLAVREREAKLPHDGQAD